MVIFFRSIVYQKACLEQFLVRDYIWIILQTELIRNFRINSLLLFDYFD